MHIIFEPINLRNNINKYSPFEQVKRKKGITCSLSLSLPITIKFQKTYLNEREMGEGKGNNVNTSVYSQISEKSGNVPSLFTLLHETQNPRNPR